jgi:hypothetical protein
VGRRKALGWLGAAVCSVALVIAGGLVLSSFAVHRYLQASHSAMQRGESPAAGTTPALREVATLKRTVAELAAMPGVASATMADTADTADTADYDVAVTMRSGATAGQCGDVVFTMTKELQNSRVNLELTMPASDGRAASVVDYRNAFDTPVPRSTVDSVSRAVGVAAAVPGVTAVHVTVPYTWNLAAGDLNVTMSPDAPNRGTALQTALAHTALAGVAWSGSPLPHASGAAPSASAPRASTPSATHASPPHAAPTPSPTPTRTAESPRVSDPASSPTPSTVASAPAEPSPSR